MFSFFKRRKPAEIKKEEINVAAHRAVGINCEFCGVSTDQCPVLSQTK